MIAALLIFLSVILIKFSINLTYYVQCKKYYHIYKQYLKKASWTFTERKHKVIKLLKNAGIEDTEFVVLEHIGYGMGSKAQVSYFKNIDNRRDDVIGTTHQMFHQAIGVYRTRMIDAISPLFWLEYVIYLPRNIISYLGIADKDKLVKVLQLIYWTLSILLIILNLLKMDVWVRIIELIKTII